ncbi:MAG: type II toxin-antitoxin system RelE/ParE family toxin [Bacteroidales bacterium]|nr:type II toxin-antitoxin system RelE/ParE family toxin [Bacteroidales bacterium]
MRNLIRSVEFDEFYNSLPANIQNKVKYAMNVIAEIRVVNTKLIKKLVDTDFYELRISVGNEYRVILFTIDHENFIEAQQILLLNGFLKKSTKDYKKEIEKAKHILNTLSDESED